MTEEESLSAIEEIEVQGRWNSPYIVRYYDSFIDDKSRINIVMEYCENGDLHSYLNKRQKHVSEVTIWRFFVQITLGLHYLHSQDIFHRDLKSLNIFLTKDYSVKIGDLGEATIKKNNSGNGGKQQKLNFNIAVGTPYYFSPELWNGSIYTDKWDIWALGWILYELWWLWKPFEGKDYDELKEKILSGKYKPIPKIYSSSLSNLVGTMLNLDPKKRPSTEDIIDSKAFQRQSIILHLNKLSNPNNSGKSEKYSYRSTTSNSLYKDLMSETPDTEAYKDKSVNRYTLVVENRMSSIPSASSKMKRLLTPIRKQSNGKTLFSINKNNLKTRIVNNLI